MKSLKGSQTEKNILIAFSGESQARNRYTYYAAQAKKDGFVFVSKIFEETADQEKEHAKRLFKFLEGGPLEISGTFPAGVIADTRANLLEAAAGEHEEYTHMYPTFAEIAEKEGFYEVATAMRNILIAENYHERRFLDLAEKIKNDTMFKDPKPTVWRCLNCGCLVDGPEAPDVCPACLHPQAYFVRLDIKF